MPVCRNPIEIITVEFTARLNAETKQKNSPQKTQKKIELPRQHENKIFFKKQETPYWLHRELSGSNHLPKRFDSDIDFENILCALCILCGELKFTPPNLLIGVCLHPLPIQPGED